MWMSAAAFLLPLAIMATGSAALARSNTTTQAYNYAQVLRYSLLFYEAQRSGHLPDTNRIPWRGDSSLNDKGNGGEDLTGGYHDAGDYVKFGFPFASAMTVLSWGYLTFKDAFISAGQVTELREAVKWGTDYMMKAHVAANQFYCQVGAGAIDHDYAGRPEDMTVDRPAFKLDSTHPGSDCAGETAAALAAASLVFAGPDAAYSDKLLSHAKTLFDFADKHRGLYSDVIADANEFYSSSEYEDELVWAAAWLYKATGDQAYLTKAEQMYTDSGLGFTPWSFDWSDKLAGAQLLLYELTKKSKYQTRVEAFCDYAMNDVPRSPKGQVHLAKWGSNRYAANFAFICIQAAAAGLHCSSYRAFAQQQIGYMLGDAGHSYVVGFGHNPPVRPHHKAAACPSPPAKCDWDTFESPDPNPHVLTGALVGGPKFADDKYVDDRQDYIANEVTLDYNAGFQGAVAGLLGLTC